MTWLRFLSIFFVVSVARAEVAPPPLKLRLKVQLWRALCQERVNESANCGLPEAMAAPKIVEMELSEPQQEGAVSFGKVSLQVDKANMEFKVFNMWPQAKFNLPPYLQIQAAWLAPSRARCMISVKRRDPMQSPPMICSVEVFSNEVTPGHYVEWGSTIEFDFPK